MIRALDNALDWTFGKGRNNFLVGINEIRLNIQTRLLSFRGDCFFSLDEGVDYNSYLDRGTQGFLEQDIRRVILSTPNVRGIVSLTSELDRGTRALRVNTTVSTYLGNITMEVTI